MRAEYFSVMHDTKQVFTSSCIHKIHFAKLVIKSSFRTMFLQAENLKIASSFNYVIWTG